MSAFERLISASKHSPRGVHPFLDIGLVMTHGAECQWGPPPDANCFALSKEYALSLRLYALRSPARGSFDSRDEELIGAFDKLFAVAPELLLVVKQFCIEITDKAEQWDRLIITVLSPPVPEQELKSDRGLAHPIHRYYIVGYKDRLKLPPLCYSPAPDVEYVPSNRSISSSRSPPRMHYCRRSWLTGKYQLEYKPYPSFLYEDGKFDPNNLDAGLLRSDAVLRFLRHIWLGPSAALSGAEKISKTCNASLHNVKKGASRNDLLRCPSRSGTHDSRNERVDTTRWELFTASAELEHPWVIDVLEWYQSQMLQNVDFDSDAEQDKDSDDEDDVLAQRRRRAAAAIGS
ncbi:hypothetical protein R3P38DRAFT_3230789 [Favolaschia claudopus]|uniref:Uncharacterized protein n=1 Tax=Favolaschia claudopus TaxID=2862362 RepID=A0AAV9ZLN9_9AGAR